ncbi:MAG: NADH-quinone oxidoreductase subunit G [Actinomycetota bacterium]|nr:MAG: NADH-quinone oxidoreductase subunit G [Actinomycetota bacterium]
MTDEPVTLTIDGKEITVPAQTLIIRAAEQLGIEIPRFCDHPFLEPAGACRQCYVEIEGQPKLATSCTVRVAPGMVVRTQETSELAREAQVANLEFLLLNHPLDCPVCDRGGECPLQDQALAFGPGESRYREAKRVYEKPIPLSPLVNLDRERCVLCARCTRFCDEISGDRFIELFERGAGERVSIAAGEDFRSPFSGNTIQICPVGALTSETYRFVARPFDLTSADGVCPHCSAGCNLRVDVRRGQVVRHLARDNAEVNDAWTCDKGRFAFRYPDDPARITTPLLRDRGLEPASFGEVLGWVADRCVGSRVAFLTGGRLLDEDYYALSKLARTVVGTNDLDHRRHEGGAVEVWAASRPMSVAYADVERAPAVLVVGLDAEQEVPILHLRLRKAARKGARITVVHPRRTRLHDVAAHVLCRPGEEASLLREAVRGAGPLASVVEELGAAGGAGVVLAGERCSSAGAEAALALARTAGARFGYVVRRANDRGALRAGVHPRLLPGGRAVDDPAGRAALAPLWGDALPSTPGRGRRAILEAAAAGELDVLFLIGIDPLTDLPDGALARRALENVPVKVVQSLELGDLEPFADAFLPAAAPVEKAGHVTTWEGRRQRVEPVRGPVGLSRPDWEILAGLAAAMGGDLGFETLDQLDAELERVLEAGLGTPDAGAVEPFVGPDPRGGEEAPTAADPGSLLLFTYPLLVDEGRLSARADELKAALQDPAFVEVHPDDAARLGLAEGAAALVTTEAGRAEVPVRLNEHLAPGTAFVPFNNPGLVAGTLLAGSFWIPAGLEPATVSRAREASA